MAKAAVWSMPTFCGFCVTVGFPKRRPESALCPPSTMSTKRKGPVHPCSDPSPVGFLGSSRVLLAVAHFHSIRPITCCRLALRPSVYRTFSCTQNIIVNSARRLCLRWDNGAEPGQQLDASPAANRFPGKQSCCSFPIQSVSWEATVLLLSIPYYPHQCLGNTRVAFGNYVCLRWNNGAEPCQSSRRDRCPTVSWDAIMLLIL